MIEIKGIRKSFGSLQVLKGIDLKIDKGEVVSIVGPSGAGKTTLLQIIGTLDRADSGTVVVDGVDTNGMNARRLAATVISVSCFSFTSSCPSSRPSRTS